MYNENYNAMDPMYQPPVSNKPMNWYKFLIYFALFAGALVNLINAYSFLSGAQYDGSADAVYWLYPGLKTLDIIVGILSILAAVLGICARFQLAKRTAKGPKLLTYLYALSAIVNAIYAIGFVSIVGDSVEVNMTSTISAIVTAIVMIFVNKQYFKNRSDIFVN